MSERKREDPVPTEEHRAALRRAGVPASVARLVPELFTYTLGERLLRLERDVVSQGEKTLLRIRANVASLEHGLQPFLAEDELRTRAALQTARDQLAGARYGVEAALGVLQWQRSRSAEAPSEAAAEVEELRLAVDRVRATVDAWNSDEHWAKAQVHEALGDGWPWPETPRLEESER